MTATLLIGKYPSVGTDSLAPISSGSLTDGEFGWCNVMTLPPAKWS